MPRSHNSPFNEYIVLSAHRFLNTLIVRQVVKLLPNTAY